MSKKMEKEIKERVVLYVYYDDCDIDYACEKEKMLRKFCEDNNYDVVGIFRSPYYSDFDGLSPDIKTIMEDAKKEKFDRFLCYSLNEIADSPLMQAVISYIIDFCGVCVETIIEGKLDIDFFYGVSVFENCNQKKELDKLHNPYSARFVRYLDAYQLEKPETKNNDNNDYQVL